MGWVHMWWAVASFVSHQLADVHITMGLAESAAGAAWRSMTKGFSNDLQSRNWSVYGQWLGMACFVINIVLGAVNLLHLSLVIIFGILAIIEGILILFLEAGFLLKICPVTERFTGFIRFFHNNLPRAGFYLLLAVIQYLSLVVDTTSLLACAILMTIVSMCYALAYFTKQEFIKSSTLGGDGVAREMMA